MSRRHKALRRARYNAGIRRCQRCKNVGISVLCYLPDPPRFYSSDQGEGHFTAERAPDEVLCLDCAPRQGYCYSCGDFWAGINSFDFIHPGICDHCHDAARQDFDDGCEDEDWDFWDDPMCML